MSTSTPPAFAPEQVSLFRKVLHVLNEQKVSYAVAGAFALHQHTGIWRTTKDLDLFLPIEHVGGAIRHLENAGLQCDIVDPAWLAKTRSGNYFVDLITGMSNGIVTADQSWIDRSTPAEILGVNTRVLAAEELLASKLFVLFRERFDGADMVHVIYATRGKLDWQRILSLAGEHRELLLAILVLFLYVYPCSGHYVPKEIWDYLLGEVRHTLAKPAGRPSFRGILLDEKMFAIDVKEWGLPNLLEERHARSVRKIERCPSQENTDENRRAG